MRHGETQNVEKPSAQGVFTTKHRRTLTAPRLPGNQTTSLPLSDASSLRNGSFDTTTQEALYVTLTLFPGVQVWDPADFLDDLHMTVL
jgi:hypothetical protein